MQLFQLFECPIFFLHYLSSSGCHFLNKPSRGFSEVEEEDLKDKTRLVFNTPSFHALGDNLIKRKHNIIFSEFLFGWMTLVKASR